MKTELIKTINELKEVIKETNLKVSDKELLNRATRIYISQEINKSKNTYNNISKKLNNEREEPLATEKQLWALKQAKKTIPEGLTKKEASKIISKLKGNEK